MLTTEAVYTSDSYSCSSHLSDFQLLSQDDMIEILCDVNDKTCVLDPLPPAFIKKHQDIFVPILHKIVNTALGSGIFPDELKHAVVSPIIKSKNIDSEIKKQFSTRRFFTISFQTY